MSEAPLTYSTPEEAYWTLREMGESAEEAAGFAGFVPECDRLNNEEVRLWHELQAEYVRDHPEECPTGIAPPHVRLRCKFRVKRSRPVYA